MIRYSRWLFFEGTALLMAALLGCAMQQTSQPAAEITPPALANPSVTLPPPSGGFVSGIVLNPEGGPLAKATVRIQATTNQTVTDDAGRFVLANLEAGVPVTVSAWKEGYYCAKIVEVTPPADGIEISMRLVQTNDNPDYPWIPPIGQNSCYSCKPGVTQVWLDNDAHGKSALNPRFLTMYNGTDVDGNRSPLTSYGSNRDYGRFPLRPDFSQPYFGPGYKLDFPDTTGNCAACHIPGAAIDAPYATDPNTVSGVNLFGVHCDYCHKIAAVRLDPDTGLPFANMPGVLSQDIRRPFPEDPDRYQIFFGTFDDDNVPMEDTNLPLIQDSQWCAPCHYGAFWDTVIYNSFGEWLESSYSDPNSGKTCQQCHMPAPTIINGQPLTNVAAGKDGVERDPLTIKAHTFPGASNLELLQNAVTLNVQANRETDRLIVEVEVVNDQTGHAVPTDSPLRQMILLVLTSNNKDEMLAQISGPTVPEWGGIGDPIKGYYAGLPGKGYAKILSELWTEITPTGAYWNPTRIEDDNRLLPFESDKSTYSFYTPRGEAVNLKVSLLFRRAFKELMDRKGWDIPDILMEQAQMTIE